MKVFALCDRDGAEPVLLNPLSPVAEKVIVAGIFGEHVSLFRSFDGLLQANQLLLSVRPRDFREDVTTGFHRETRVFDLDFAVARDHNSIQVHFQQRFILRDDPRPRTLLIDSALRLPALRRKAVTRSDDVYFS